jgi:tripartite-type tricarboxylate transporter receptor subunit TctC
MMTVKRRDMLAGLAALPCLTIVASREADAQSYPARPVRLLVGAPAGSIPDVVCRMVTEALARALANPVVIENRPGPGGGMGAMQALVASPPDGYTLGLANMSSAVFDSYLFSNLSYDPLRDFSPISLLASNTFSLAVRNDFPANSIAELIAWAKAQPGKLNVGTGPAGSPPHVFAHLMAQIAGIKVTYVPYRGGGPNALTGLLRGDMHVLVDSPGIMIEQVRAGAIKVLMVTGATRDTTLPDVPTVVEAGFPAAQFSSWFGLAAPARTPLEIINRLNGELSAILAEPALRQRLTTFGFTALGGSPDDFHRLLTEEHARWGAVIRASGLRLN